MSGEGWQLAPHVCRFCLGRIVRRADMFRCSSCGVTAEKVGAGIPTAICGCGMRPSSKGREHLKGFACGPNPDRSPKSPSEFVITFAGAVMRPLEEVQ